MNKIVNNMKMLAKLKKDTLGYSYLVQTEADGPGVVNNVHEIYNAEWLADRMINIPSSPRINNF
jgi:dTDP-4-amino-4,6-dideoxygalactose transaminase